ncbi:MAG: FAD-dependent thymidylate synthase [Elusimicrobia bacterium]|nr:FAD-dependent thymidylate synthase [Elusimicrobiota bacterium]
MRVEILSVTPDAEKLIERAGRVCYKSEKRIKQGSAGKFIKSLIRAGHLSVLEHATVTVLLRGVSRSMTHQLVRHRLCSFSQQSQRYVSGENFSFVIPPRIAGNRKAKKKFLAIMKIAAKSYGEILSMGIPKEDARFVLPNACVTEIVFSCNFRQLRHIFILRGAPRAQWEIRKVFIELLKKMKKIAPNCFFDLAVNRDEETIEMTDGEGQKGRAE